MDCVTCGLLIDPDDPTWAVYAWDAFEFKILEAMPMHQECFSGGEWIEASWWENDDDANAVLRSGQELRLLEAEGPGMYIWGVDPQSSEPALIPYVAAKGARRA